MRKCLFRQSNQIEKPYLIKGCSDTARDSNICVCRMLKDSENSIYYKMGYMLYAPILLSFCQWIHEYCVKKNIDYILFLARDGYIVKKAWTMLYEDIDGLYFFASRSSVLDIRLKDNMTISWLVNSITDKKIISVKGILDALDLPVAETDSLRKQYGISKGMMIDSNSFQDDMDLKAFFDDLLPIIETRINSRSELFESYVQNSLKQKDKVAVVDVGWRGTIQEAIEKAIKNENKKTEIHGLYLGLYDEKHGRRNIKNAEGFLYNSEGIDRLKKLKTLRGLIELFFSAPHGKAIQYERVDNFVKPILDEYEYIKEFGYQSKDEIALREMQRGALDYIYEMKDLTDIKKMMSRDEAIMPLYIYSISPHKQDIEILGDLHFCSDTMEAVASPRGLFQYFDDLRELKRDFSKSVWKIGFMRRLLWNIPFPYRLMFNFLLMHYGVI